MQIARLNSTVHFLQRLWADECVVYVIDSGATHLLNPDCARVLHLLSDGPRPVAALAQDFQTDPDKPESDVDSAASLFETIEGLSKIGLVETFEQTN